MANDFSVNPWYIDTPMATPYNSYCKVTNIIWSEMVAATDQLIIVDRHGKVIVDTKGQAGLEQQVMGSFGWVNGFQATTLTAGKVAVVVSKS